MGVSFACILFLISLSRALQLVWTAAGRNLELTLFASVDI